MGTAPEVTDIEQLAHRLCRLNRSAGGYKATGELLEIAREFHPDFQRLPLAYRNGKPGPDAVFVGSHPAHASTVVTAHYDTLGASGGCDNTSGVVAILLLAALVRTDRDGNWCLALLPREEPPFYGSRLMGSQALLDMMGKEPTAFVAVDTIGGRKGLGKRMLEVCGNDHVLPEGWTDGMAVDERKLHRLSDARNFPESGVLLTDELVLEVPMHTEEDTVEDVDWAFVAAAAKKLAELI